jgi:hypothetical protein
MTTPETETLVPSLIATLFPIGSSQPKYLEAALSERITDNSVGKGRNILYVFFKTLNAVLR